MCVSRDTYTTRVEYKRFDLALREKIHPDVSPEITVAKLFYHNDRCSRDIGNIYEYKCSKKSLLCSAVKYTRVYPLNFSIYSEIKGAWMLWENCCSTFSYKFARFPLEEFHRGCRLLLILPRSLDIVTLMRVNYLFTVYLQLQCQSIGKRTGEFESATR